MKSKYNPIVKKIKEGEAHFYEGFGIDCKREKEIFRLLSEITNIESKKKTISFLDIINIAASIAQNDGEFAMLCFDIGRQFEQQKMEQAAAIAEKLIIPGLMKGQLQPLKPINADGDPEEEKLPN